MNVVEGDGKTDREGFLTSEEVRLGSSAQHEGTICVLFDVIEPSEAVSVERPFPSSLV